MISLVFLVCSVTLGCISEGPPEVFLDEASCHNVALDLIEENSKLVREGKLPQHAAIYKCINWGDPA